MAIAYEGGTEQVRQIVHHHALLRRGLERRAGTVCDAVAGGVSYQRQVAILRGYLDEAILPHAEAEERTLCRAAAAQARGSELVRALIHEHRELAYLAGRLRPGVDGSMAHPGNARRPGSAPRAGGCGRRTPRRGDRRDGDAASFR